MNDPQTEFLENNLADIPDEVLHEFEKREIKIIGRYPGTSEFNATYESFNVRISIYNPTKVNEFRNARSWHNAINFDVPFSLSSGPTQISPVAIQFDDFVVSTVLDDFKVKTPSGKYNILVTERLLGETFFAKVKRGELINTDDVLLLAYFTHQMESSPLLPVSPALIKSLKKHYDPRGNAVESFINNAKHYAGIVSNYLGENQQVQNLVKKLSTNIEQIKDLEIRMKGLHGAPMLANYFLFGGKLGVHRWSVATSRYWVPYYETASNISYITCWLANNNGLEIAKDLLNKRVSFLKPKEREYFNSVFKTIASQRLACDLSDVTKSNFANDYKTSDGFDIDLKKVTDNINELLNYIESITKPVLIEH